MLKLQKNFERISQISVHVDIQSNSRTSSAKEEEILSYATIKRSREYNIYDAEARGDKGETVGD